MQRLGDQQDLALDTFINDRDKLLALALTFVGNRAVAEDLLQDSWIRWSGRNYPPHQAKPIFRRIVANLARDWHRRQKTERVALATHKLTFDPALDSERVVIARQDLRHAVRALGSLPARHVLALRLRRVEGLSYAQIAERIGTVPSRAYTLVAEAIVHVAIHLDD